MTKRISSVMVMSMMILTVTATFTFAQANKDAKAPEAAPASATKAPAAGEFESAGQAAGEQAPAPTPAEGEATEEGEAGKDAPKPPKGPFEGNYFFFIMIGGILLLWIFMGRGRKKKEAQRKAMLESLSKGDRVVTIGGIVGTVVEARETELVVKVDDNTRMKFARWAVRNAGDAANEDKKQDTQEQQ